MHSPIGSDDGEGPDIREFRIHPEGTGRGRLLIYDRTRERRWLHSNMFVDVQHYR